MPTPITPPESRGAPPPTSGLAVASLVCGVLLCCPVTSLAAVALGILGLRATSGTPARRRGRRLALAGLALGGFGLIAQVVLQNWFAGIYMPRLDVSMETAVEEVLAGAAEQDRARVLAVWSARADAPAAAAVESFGAAVRTRLGPYQGLSIVIRTPGGTMLEPTMTIAATFEFERGERTGAVTFDLVPRMDSMFPAARVTEIVVEDASHEPLRLP